MRDRHRPASGPPGLSGAPAWVATLFGVGLLRPAPGTWGSLAVLPPALAIMWAAGPWAVFGAALIVLVAGLAATAVIARSTPPGIDPDHGSIVIDEACGQLIAVIPALLSPLLWVLAFVLFRFFDIWKPWPIRTLERRLDGAWAIMLDDVAAGAAAAACVWAISGTGIADVR